jgi:hypothetical protein
MLLVFCPVQSASQTMVGEVKVQLRSSGFCGVALAGCLHIMKLQPLIQQTPHAQLSSNPCLA